MGLDGDKYSHSLLEMFSVLKNAYLCIYLLRVLNIITNPFYEPYIITEIYQLRLLDYDKRIRFFLSEKPFCF